MKNLINTKYFLLGLALLIGLLIGWFLKPSTRLVPEESSKHESAKEDLVYTCSMHPQIRKNEEGDCPICGMDLIPLASINSQLDPQAISMSATALQLAQVATIKVGTDAATKTLRLNGKVQADERLSFTQSSHIPGRIEELSLNFTGEFMRKGQTIAKVYSPALVSAQEELLEAFKLREDQPALFLAAKERLKNWKLSDAQVEDIINSKKSIERFPILANVSGYVEKKMVKLGDYIKQGDALYQIVDLSKVWVLFDVYEADLAWIEQGDSLRFSLPSLADKNYKTVISYIDPLINPKTRVAQARVSVSNLDLKLKPEMLAQGLVQAETANKSAVIVIPKSAIMWTGKSSVVYVMDRSQGLVNFKMRRISLGVELGDSYVIESGLKAGEEIAVNGTFSIDAAAQLAGKPSMMNPEGGAASQGHNHDMPSARSKDIEVSLSAPQRKAMKPLFEAYFKMKEALVVDDFNAAKKAGLKIQSALSGLASVNFEGESQDLWQGYVSKLKNNTEHLAHYENIEALRQGFLKISRSLISISENFKPLSDTVYVQHCPMADSYKGADWLSMDEAVLNPYFGQSMISCGSVTSIID